MTRQEMWRQFIEAAQRKGRAFSAYEVGEELHGGDSEAALQTAKECVEAGLLTNCRHYWHMTVTEQGLAFIRQVKAD